jgi:hypothetical protein
MKKSQKYEISNLNRVHPTLLPAKKRSKRSAVILHGMVSKAASMKQLAASLKSRGVYDKIILVNLSLGHRIFPRALAKFDAQTVVERIKRRLRDESIDGLVDILGHSNGGYVAVTVANLLPELVVNVFTIATPHSKDLGWMTSVKHPEMQKVFHLFGGVDIFSSVGCSFNPTKSSYLFLWQDEGHCSIHGEADSNGVADFIQAVRFGPPTHWFVDSKETLHIWEWCQEEYHGTSFEHLRHDRVIGICNGLHGQTSERIKGKIKRLPKNPIDALVLLGEISVNTIINIWRFERYYQKQAEMIKEECASLNMVLNGKKEDVRQLKLKQKRLIARAKQFEKALDTIVKRRIDSLGQKKKKLNQVQAIVLAGLRARHLAEMDIKVIIDMLKEANGTHRDLLVDLLSASNVKELLR